jgi:hypothetical protein
VSGETPGQQAGPAGPLLDATDVALGRGWKRVDGGRRVAVLLQFAQADDAETDADADADAAQVLGAVLARLNGSGVGALLVGGNSYVLGEDEDPPVHLVVPGDAHGEHRGARPAVYVDDEAAAHEHARGIGGLVIEADVIADYRAAGTAGPGS